MGTRGMIAVQSEGRLVGTYNHYDSYPTGLGRDIAGEAVWMYGNRERVARQVAALRLVDEMATPSAEDRARHAATLQQVSTGSDWYALLRGMQGSLKAYLDAGVMPDNLAFAHDSLFCEWAYVVDLDENVLEIYEGFQTEPHDRGRFADAEVEPEPGGRTYYPVALVRKVLLWDLADMTADQIAEMMSDLETTEA